MRKFHARLKMPVSTARVHEIKVALQTYELCSEGLHPAVLADIVDLGLVDTQYGKKPKINFVYFTAEVDSQGKQKRLFERFSPSLNVKSLLRKRLTGPGFALKIDADNPEVETESLIGTQLQVLVTHNDGTGPNAGKRFANITGTAKAKLGQAVEVPKDFKRDKDRDDKPSK